MKYEIILIISMTIGAILGYLLGGVRWCLFTGMLGIIVGAFCGTMFILFYDSYMR